MNYSDLVNSTIGNNKPSLVGLFYFDCLSKKWFIITSSEPLFTEIHYSFGAKWPMLRHRITGKKPASAKQVQKVMNCNLSTFSKMVA